MTGHLDRPEMIKAILASDLPPKARRAMCACVGLASCDGLVEPVLGLIAPMSGVRFYNLKEALPELQSLGWLRPVGDRFRVEVPPNHQGSCQ